MKFVAVGFLSLLCGLCLLSNPAITDDATGNQPAAAAPAKKVAAAPAKQIEELRNEITDLRNQLESCDCATLQKQVSDVATLQKLVIEQGILIGGLKKELRDIDEARRRETAEIQKRLEGKVGTTEVPAKLLAQMQNDKKDRDAVFGMVGKVVDQSFGILKVKNLSGNARELFVDGVPHLIPADAKEHRLKVLLDKVVLHVDDQMKDEAMVTTELRPFEGAKSRTLKRNAGHIFEGEKTIEILLFANSPQ